MEGKTRRYDEAHPVADPNTIADFESEDASLADELLSLHAGQIIQQLQQWSAELDAREAELNARAAILANQERRIRTRLRSQRADLEERLRATKRKETELADRLHRIAVAEIDARKLA